MVEKWVDFLSELKQNNNTTWFHANRPKYLEVKSEFEQFVSELIYEMVKIDPDLGLLTPKDCLYRINRDIRFTNDKSPYKTWLAASFETGGRGSQKSTYYFHISSNNTAIVGGGLYDPNNNQLKNFRQNVVEKPQEILKILNDKEFVKGFSQLAGEKLIKLPRGFKSGENDELLKHKSMIAHKTINLDSLGIQSLKSELLKDFTILKPLVVYLRNKI